MQPSSSLCGTCPICLSQISPETEAFLDVCFHSFCFDVSWIDLTTSFATSLQAAQANPCWDNLLALQCIKQWTSTQEGPTLACPLCKQPYYSIIYDCHDTAFR